MPKPRQNPPDLDLLRHLLDYDPVTGEFSRRVRSSHAFPGDPVGCLRSDGYLQASIRGKTYLLHRLAIYHVTGEWPSDEVDHINDDKADNRLFNLRLVDSKTNKENRRKLSSRKRKSSSLGVAQLPSGRWGAYISHNYKTQYVGSFHTETEAAEAYFNRKREIHSGFVG